MFRDTFAVELLLAGVPIDQVSLLLGHSSVKVTEKHDAPEWGCRSSLTQLVLGHIRGQYRTVVVPLPCHYSTEPNFVEGNMGTLPVKLGTYRSCTLVVLGVIGICAFVFSAISSQDDNYQHECIRGGRMLRIVVKCTKASSAKSTGHHVQSFASMAKEASLRTQRADLPHKLEAVQQKPHFRSSSSRAPPIS